MIRIVGNVRIADRIEWDLRNQVEQREEKQEATWGTHSYGPESHSRFEGDVRVADGDSPEFRLALDCALTARLRDLARGQQPVTT